jgi:hypothetical protein
MSEERRAVTPIRPAVYLQRLAFRGTVAGRNFGIETAGSSRFGRD